MKWSSILLSCFMLLILPATSRAESKQGRIHSFYVGGQGSLTLAGFGGPGPGADPSEDYRYGPGFGVGGFGGIQLQERFRLQLELNFSLKRPRSMIDGIDSARYQWSYIEVPVLGRVALAHLGRVEPYGALGSNLGILSSAMLDLADGNQVDITDRVARLDVGLLVGIGASVAVTRDSSLSFEIRYNHGLRNWNTSETQDGREFMHRTIYFLVGYQAFIGAKGFQ